MQPIELVLIEMNPGGTAASAAPPKAAAGDESKAAAAAAAAKDGNSCQAEDRANSSGFSRNSGKYATLPVKKGSDVMSGLEVDHYSDGEFDDGTASVDSVEMTSAAAARCHHSPSDNSQVKKSVIAAAGGGKRDAIAEECEDVSRPIDKNDVD